MYNENANIIKNTDASKIISDLLTDSYKRLNDVEEYYKDYKDINVPLIAFISRLGLLLWGPFNPEIKSSDVTLGGTYLNLGHLDIYIGTNALENVNMPTIKWLDNRY